MSNSGIYVALSGAMAQNTALDVTANNIANASTAGYHAERLSFSEALTKAGGGPNNAKDTAWVQTTSGHTDTTPGIITPTGNPLDAAITGDGYFSVQTPRGVRYTRDGHFQLNSKSQLVTSDGSMVLNKQQKPISIPPGTSNVSLDRDGEVSADGNNVGSIQIARFNPAQLSREGANMFVAQGQPLKGGPAQQIQPEAIETANFNVVRGVVDLVKVSRSYEALHKMIESYGDIDQQLTKLGSGG